MTKKEKWVITTSQGDINISHLSQRQRQVALAEIRARENFYWQQRFGLLRKHLSTPVFKKRRR